VKSTLFSLFSFFLCDNLLLQKNVQSLCENTVFLCVNLIDPNPESTLFNNIHILHTFKAINIFDFLKILNLKTQFLFFNFQEDPFYPYVRVTNLMRQISCTVDAKRLQKNTQQIATTDHEKSIQRE
jgi:hypothetical protein